MRVSGVESVDLVGLDDTRTTAVLSVIPASGPNDPATTVLVKEIRSHSGQLARAAQASVGVTGFTALAIDVSDRLTHILPTYLGVVLALTLIILLVVFRSVIVPLKATLGFLLSIAATFGATTAVFQWGDYLMRLEL